MRWGSLSEKDLDGAEVRLMDELIMDIMDEAEEFTDRTLSHL